MKRVVVTGLGIVCPIGNDLKTAWDNAVSGKNGISKVTLLDLTNEPVQIGGEVKDFKATDWMEDKEARRSQRFCHFAVAASKMALSDANLKIDSTNANDVGVAIGVGVGGLEFLEQQILTIDKKGSKWVSPFTIPAFIANMAAGIASIEVGAKGPNICPTTACSSGTHAIGEALMLIQTGRAKAMLAGGAEACFSMLSFSGFAKMKAMVHGYNDKPEKASRPFDANRGGFVMGEGAGVLVLEEYESAKARGAKIYCELVGYGMSSDAYHMTTPAPEGEGAYRCMRQALETGGLKPDEIDYINAHGTSTEFNDELETAAIKHLFGDRAKDIAISSTKSMTGHLLGAAGGIEAVFTVKALETGDIPPTINYETPDPKCDLNYTPNKSEHRSHMRAAISNSFGFGGTNACIAFKKLN